MTPTQELIDEIVAAKAKEAESEWIGVDLDCTLAHWTEWAVEIGEPVPQMVARVKAALAAGKRIKIMTARAWKAGQSSEQYKFQIQMIQEWCLKHIGQILEITNEKDFYMTELWDDRAKQVVPNEGVFVEDLLASFTGIGVEVATQI